MAGLAAGMLNAAQMALFDFADDQFELAIYDTHADPEAAGRAAALAIGDGASLILGPLLASSVNAVAPSARAAGVNVIAFSSDRTVAGDGIYTMGFLPSAEVTRVVRYAGSRGIRRFAALAPNNDYGVTAVDALERVVEEVGGTVNRIEFYDPYATEFSDPVRRLADYDSRRAALLAQRAELSERDDEIARRALKRLEKITDHRRSAVRCPVPGQPSRSSQTPRSGGWHRPAESGLRCPPGACDDLPEWSPFHNRSRRGPCRAR